MPVPISRHNRFPNASIENIARNMLPTRQPWTPGDQQRAFNSAMEILGRPGSTPYGYILMADEVFSRLAQQYNRTWSGRPSVRNYMVNNSNGNSNSNSNTSTLAPSSAALQAPNYSKASGAVKKWLAARPHTVHQNVVKIKAPANARDPVSYKNFGPGNEAVMVIKKYLQKNGQMRSKRTFYEKNIVERLSGQKWRTILRMKGSDMVMKDPLNRRSVYRRDIMNVKFV